MKKKDLQVGESQLQNSNSATSQIQEQKTPRYESIKMVLNQAQYQTEKQQKHLRVAITYKLNCVIGRYTSHSELTR